MATITPIWSHLCDQAELLVADLDRVDAHFAAITKDGQVTLAEYHEHVSLLKAKRERLTIVTGLATKARGFVLTVKHWLDTGTVSRDIAREHPDLVA